MQIKLSSIIVYPFKALAGISLDEVELDDFGPLHDLRWMLVNDRNSFLTQRLLPKLVMIQPKIQGNWQLFHAAGMPELELPLVEELGKLVEVEIFGNVCTGIETFKKATDWISIYLGWDCKSVYMPVDSFRQVDCVYSKKPVKTSFTDGFPFLLISEASLDELNSRLERQLEMRRFRPNLVLNGTSAYTEDDWDRICIGSIAFKVVKLCARCQVTAVEPELGIFSGKEPLTTLATYRRFKGQASFGQNLIHEDFGSLKLDNPIELLSSV